MVNLTDKELALIKSILSKYPYRFFAFGSCVKGSQKKYSDLDLCYKDSISDVIISNIHEEFEQSNLPFKVELLSWHRCDADFQKSIEKDLVEISSLIVSNNTD